MSNSPLVSYIKLSPNVTSPRNRKIDTVTIHCVVGQVSVETLGDIFTPKARKASSNYGIGSDGRIGMYCEEKDRSWCSSSSENDHRAITIECASDKTHPYAINDKVYKSLINLLVDICERNDGIPELRWQDKKSLIGNTKKQNMTVHRWFSNTACPGHYIYNKLGKIASDVNERLNSETSATIYRVQTGAFKNKVNADKTFDKVKTAGFEAYMVIIDGLYKVQVGAFMNKSNAEAEAIRLRSAGFDTYIDDSGRVGVPASKTSKRKTNEQLAKEVIQGLWGNGDERRKRLSSFGYDYKAVQKRVNELL